MFRSTAPFVSLLLAALVIGGCGDEDQEQGKQSTSQQLPKHVRDATRSSTSGFPAPDGRTLQEVGDAIGAAGPEVVPAGSTYTPGKNRFAFGILGEKNDFIYGTTVVYVAKTPSSKAEGPFAAPADLLVTDPPFRSQTAATGEDPFAAIYSTNIELPKAKRAVLLVVTKVDGQLVAAPSQVTIKTRAQDKVPAVGEKAPSVETDTLASAKGDIKSIDTRVPPDDMHDVNLQDVLGKKPVVILFATPQLCQSRVCGPVVDVAAQLKRTYGNKITFIHQEVYVDNDTKKGVRKPLQQYNLKTEPWLFAIDRDGQITARLEGSFGLKNIENAIQTALKS